MAAWSLAAVAALLRRRWAYPGADLVLVDLVAALLPVGAVLTLLTVLDPGVVALVGAGIVVLAAVVSRLPWARRSPADDFWQVWCWGALPVAAAGAALAWPEAAPAWGQWCVVAAFATLCAGAAVVPMPSPVRPWPVAALLVAAGLLAADLAGAPLTWSGTAVAAAGLLVVVVVHAARSRASVAALGSAGGVGHVLTVVGAVLAAAGWPLVAALAFVTAAAAVTAAFDVVDRSPVATLLTQADPALRLLPPAAVAGLVPATAATALAVAGTVPWWSSWSVVVPAAWALVAAAATRLPRLSVPVAAVAGWTAVLSSVAAAALVTAPWPGAVALAVVMVVAPLLAPARRPAPAVWLAWAAAAPLLGLALELAVPSFAAAPTVWRAAVVLVGVGGALAVGTASLALRTEPWRPRVLGGGPALLAPALLGAAELAVGVVLVIAGRAGGEVAAAPTGWVALAAALVLVALGLIDLLGPVAGLGALLAWWALLLLAPDAVLVQPWLGVLVAAALVVVAAGADRGRVEVAWWARWDWPFLLVAALVAAGALRASLVSGIAVPATFVLVGAEVAAVAWWWRRVPGVAPVLGALAWLLVLLGASAASPWWRTADLVVTAVVLTALATRVEGAGRVVLAVLGATTAWGAWVSLLTGLEISAWTGWDATSLAGAVVVLLAAAASMTRRVPRVWPVVWGGSGMTAVVIAIAALALLAGTLDPFAAPGSPFQWQQVAAAAGVAIGCGAAAAALRMPVLRPLAVAWGFAALAIAADIDSWSASMRVQVAVVVAVAAAVVLLALPASGRAWRPVAAVSGVLACAVALAVALWVASAPDAALALAAAAVVAGAVGVAWSSTGAQALAPVLACAAWIAYASSVGALHDDPAWSTVPVGLALLADAGLWRRDLVRSGRSPATPGVVTLEVVGVAFLVVAWFVEAVTESVAFALAAVVVGVAVSGWGVLTRVRRRVLLGAVVVVAALAVLVVVPLVPLVPGWTGAWLWIAIAVVGIGAVLVATLLEEGRVLVRRSVARLGELTAGWE